MMTDAPSFRDPAFLSEHIRHTMEFYHPRCIDRERGGFFHFFKDDGTIYDADTRHLVSSTRFIFNYAMAFRHFGDADYEAAVRHGLAFLRGAHRNPATGGYAWLLGADNEVLDGTNHCYGLAFVVLAYAKALEAGVPEAGYHLDETWELMERHFWSEADGLYRDEISAGWHDVSPYRGQNANMHSCEAMLAAFEASGETKFLDRAETLARRVTSISPPRPMGWSGNTMTRAGRSTGTIISTTPSTCSAPGVSSPATRPNGRSCW